MKIPEKYQGKLVAISLVRPVHMFEYGAHVNVDRTELITPAPVMRKVQTSDGPAESPSMTDMIMGALVSEVAEDSITIRLYVPNPDGKSGNIMEGTIPSALVLHIAVVAEYDVPMPAVRREVQTPASKVIL